MSRITDKFLDYHFNHYDTGYWRINDETVISCEGQVYVENDDNSLVWYANVDNMEELCLLLRVLKVNIDTEHDELSNILP